MNSLPRPVADANAIGGTEFSFLPCHYYPDGGIMKYFAEAGFAVEQEGLA